MARFSYALAFLASSSVSAHLYPRQTTFSNGTVSSTPTKPASSGTTPAPCCWIVAGGTALGLHKWYTSTVEHVVATVITTYIRENNGSAVAANSTTVYVDQNGTTFPREGPHLIGATGLGVPGVTIPGVPATLIDQNPGWGPGDYAATVIDNSTAVSFTFTDLVIAQPTPFDVWFYIGVYTQTPNATQTLPTGLTAWPRESCGTWDYDTYTDVEATTLTAGGSTITSYSTGAVVTSSSHVPNGQESTFLAIGKFTGGDIHQLNATYVQPKIEQVPDGRPWLPIPTGLMDWLETQEDIVEQYPYIKDCWLDQGNGQPSVHVPVNQLTVTSSHIIDVQKGPTIVPLPTPTDGGPETTQFTQHTERPETSLDTPGETTTKETPTTSLYTPKTVRTQLTKETLDSPDEGTKTGTSPNGSGTLPPITTAITLSMPRTEENQPTLDAPKTRTNSAPKAVTANPGATLDGPGDSPAKPSGTAIRVQTTEPGNNEGQPAGDQGTQGQNSPSQIPDGVGGIISAIQSVANQQNGGAQNPQNGQQGTANRPVAVITANRPAGSVAGFVVGSQTASPGGAAVTRGGSTFSALPSGSGLQVIANGQTSTIANVGAPGVAVAQGPNSDGNYVVGDNTLSAGGAAITNGGSTLSALPSGSGVQVIANGQTSTLANAAAPGITVTQGSGSDGNYVVADTTLSAGGAAITSGGSIYSALPSGSGVQVIANGNTQVLPIASPSGFQAAQLADSEIGYIIGENTLTAGGSATIYDGATFSALPSGGGILVVSDGQTSTVAIPGVTGSASVQPGSSEAEYVYAGQTLTAGGDAFTSAGTTYSALPSGSGLAIIAGDTTSTALIGATLSAASDSDLPTPVLLPANPSQLITIGDNTYTARITDGSLLVLGTQTIRPGVTTVINGETLLLTGSNLVQATGTNTSTRGLGDAIMSGIGGGSSSSDSDASSETGSESADASAAEPTSSAGHRLMLPDMRVLMVGGLVSLVFALVLA